MSSEASAPTASRRRPGEAVPEPANKRHRAAMALADKVETADLPIIDLSKFMGKEDSQEAKEECAKAADALHRFGCLIVRDPRVSTADNDKFVDMMEEYFEQPEEAKLKDTRPDLHYQVGATPHHVEKPRNQCSRMATLSDEHKPLSLCPPELDPKWRFFWRVGDRPAEAETKFPALNAAPVLPEALPAFPGTMDAWGGKMIAALRQVAEMAGRGFGVAPGVLPSMMDKAPHLLAPTGSNFNKYGELGTVLAGYHYDLNFLTIHGRSRFPGLYIWLRDGTRMAVKVPEHCLLVQAGKQFEYLSGGHVLAGFHEVVVAPATVAAIEKRKAEGKSLWRVSSTLFGHIASDQKLKPLAPFVELIKKAAPESERDAVEEKLAREYPEVYTGDQVEAELKAINLKESQAAAGAGEA